MRTTKVCDKKNCEELSHARGLCQFHYYKAWQYDDHINLPRSQYTNTELMKEWKELRGRGLTIVQAAPRLGITAGGLRRAISRSKKKENKS